MFVNTNTKTSFDEDYIFEARAEISKSLEILNNDIEFITMCFARSARSGASVEACDTYNEQMHVLQSTIDNLNLVYRRLGNKVVK